MSDIDPTKLKVVELRAELAARNLDTKGNKAVLVKRLKSALNKESGNEDAGDDADVSMDADDSQIAEDDSQTKDDSEENAGDLNDTGEEGTKEKTEEDGDEKEFEENEEGDQEAKEEEEQDKSEDADLMDGDDVGPTEDQVVIDSVTDEEPSEKRPEKRRRSRSPADKTRSRSRSPRRHHDRQRRPEDRRHRSRSRNRDHSSRHGHDRSHHRSRSKSPTKIETEPEEPFDDTLIALDKYNSDLHLQIDKTRYSAEPLTTGAFAYMWAGARASYGVKKGKTCFETKVVKHLDVGHIPDEPNRNVLRVGFSVETSSFQLGEVPLSYGYDGTGKIVTNCEFKEYGSEFGEGDVVTSFLNMDEDPVKISFAKNGKHEGTAFEITKEELGDNALYPHILSKNCSFEINFGQKEEPSFPLPEGFEDYVYLHNIPLEERDRGTKAPEKREDCEIVMMCGLPGAGKTTWALKYAEEHPEKRYNIIGSSNIIEKMKVMGEPRKKHYSGKWDSLIEKTSRCINKLLDMGARTLRNFILDQTNVYASAQRRKMRPFEGFKRKAVVIVPTDEEFKRRCEKQEKEEGRDVSDHAVNEMKANFSLPQTETVFDDIIFVELSREESEPLIKKYSEEGRKALPPPHKRFRPNDRSRGPPPRGPPGRRGGSGGYRGPPSGGRGGAIPLRVSDNRRNKKGMYGGPRPRGPPGGGHGRRMRGPPGGGNRQRSRGYQGGGNWNQGGNWKSGGGYYGQQGGYGGGGYGGGGYQQQHWNQQYYPQHQGGYNQYYNQGGYGGGGGYHQGYGYGQK